MKLKTLGIIIVITLLVLIPFSYAHEEDSSSFSIPIISEFIDIKADGMVNIEENITYHFEGMFSGVYHNIILPDDSQIENLSVETPGFYNKFEVKNNTSSVGVKVYIAKDKEMKESVSDDDVKVIFHYNTSNQVKIYNDVANFKHTLWDNSENMGVEKIVTKISVSGDYDNVKTWTEPTYYEINENKLTDNSAEITITNTNSKDTIKTELLIPRSYFNETDNSNFINDNIEDVVEQEHTDYQNNINFNYVINYLIILVSITFIVTPIGLFYKFKHSDKELDKKILRIKRNLKLSSICGVVFSLIALFYIVNIRPHIPIIDTTYFILEILLILSIIVFILQYKTKININKKL